MTAAKTRSDAWGEDLPEETRWELYRLTKPPREGGGEGPRLRSYEDARGHAAARGIPPPSRAGWYRFLARMRRDENISLVARAASSGGTAADLASEAKIDPAVAAAAFDALAVDAATDGDAKTSALYANAAAKYRDAIRTAQELALRTRAQAVKEDELRLARERFEAAERRLDAAKGVARDETLTDAERIAKIKGIFGMSA